jgi:hypothetical protein
VRDGRLNACDRRVVPRCGCIHLSFYLGAHRLLDLLLRVHLVIELIEHRLIKGITAHGLIMGIIEHGFILGLLRCIACAVLTTIQLIRDIRVRQQNLSCAFCAFSSDNAGHRYFGASDYCS